jgi:hypothetical protein
MEELELGKATILYEDPDDETVEETVDNEHVAYFQDHWIVKTGEHEEGHDVVRRIPAERVYFVERNVEAFEEEVKTLRDQVQSVADDIGTEVRTLRDRMERVTGGLQKGLGGRGDEPADDEEEVHPIEIEVEDEQRD